MSKAIQRVVDGIVDRALTENRLPWHRPWEQCQLGMSKNLKTGTVYSGVNVFSLMHETRSAYFLTYRQAQELGGQVRKGSKGSPIVWFSRIVDKRASTDDEKKFRGCFKPSTVFSIADIDGIDQPADETSTVTIKPHERIDRAEQIVNGWQDCPTIHDDPAQAFYRPSTDSVHMPVIGQFDTAEEYYSTLFHELVHSTGAKHRLDRDLSGGMKTTSYSREELVAELGACILRAHCQIDAPNVDDNSVAYLQSWASKLKDQPQMFSYAAGRATAAAELITAG